MKNSISVIVPYFNDSPVIERCLDSIANQTLQPIQIIIIDDCSDDSDVLCNIIQSKNINIDILFRRNQKNMNSAFSRNLGVNLALGDYIAFLDADDYWLEQHLELSLNEAEKKNAEFIYSDVVNVNKKNKKIIRKVTDVSNLSNQPDVLFMSPPQTNSFFFKKDLYNYVKFDESLRRHQDYQFLVDVILKYRKHVYGNFATACYCNSHRSIYYRFDIDSAFLFWSKYKDVFSANLLTKRLLSLLSLAIKMGKNIDIFFDRYDALVLVKKTWQYRIYKLIGSSTPVSKIIVFTLFKFNYRPFDFLRRLYVYINIICK